ncbi:MAG TPA: putative DNA binding domain-containing protein, partial [Bellilinea sp.]|nr:putative DNA binding domain-containing protein [Bellilinea sp.]
MEPLTNEDILQLIRRGEERPDFDFKDAINLEGDKKAKAELTKDVIAMANSGGGLIIGGIRQTPTGFSLDGMTPEELKGFDSTRLNQFVNNYCDPPINATTRVVQDGGKTFGVIIVPDFREQPHIVNRNFSEVLSEGDLLVRTGNNESRRAGPNELRELLNRAIERRQGVFQRIFQSAVTSARPQILEKTPKAEVAVPFDIQKALEEYKGFRIVNIQPLGQFPPIKLTSVKSIVEKSAIYRLNSSEISFPYATPRYANETRSPIGIFYQGQVQHSHSLYVSFFDVNGTVFTAESLWEDTYGVRHPEGSLGVLSCVLAIHESLLFLKLYYHNLGWEGKVRLKFSLESSIPRQLVHDTQNYWPLFHGYQNSMENPVSVERDVETGIDLEGIEKLVADISQEFFWFFNFD